MKTIIGIFLCMAISISAMENNFTMHEITADYDEGMEISSIDFDNDGDFDLLTAGTDCVLWLNEGNGNFTETSIFTNSTWTRSIRAADLDDDGDNDIVIAALASNQVVIVENTGSGFVPQVLDGTLIMPHTIDLKDLDSDGDIDILCSEFDTSNALSEVVWWRNDGGLNFSDKIVISEVFQQSTYVFADFINSDEFMDVVACGEETNDIFWWENDGNQNFGEAQIVDQNFNRVHTVVGNDLDGDGDVDILGSACVGGLLAWWENDGEGDFTRNDLGPFGGALWMDCADFDNDGDNDLFAVGQGAGNAYIYENLGNEDFEDFPLPGVFGDGFSATARDFDNDGDMDLAAIGRSSGQICWWENHLFGANFEASQLSGNFPCEISFTDESNFNEPISMWMWDFDNDGSFDSFEQSPNWTYEEEGTYSVRLVVLVDEETRSIIKEDLIQIFNGHTAIEFTELENHVIFPPETTQEFSDSFTLETWIYPYSYGPDTNFGLGHIFDKTALKLLLSKEFPIYPENSLVLQMQHEDGTLSTSTTSENSILLNQWIHIAVSYDGIDLVELFVNGEDMLDVQTITPSGNLEENSNEALYLGNSNELSKSFDGIIDEVRIWAHFSDETVIQDNMNKYLHGWETGLTHYWKLNEANGELVNDLTGANTGYINDASWCYGIELDPVGINQTHIIEPVKELTNYPNPFNPSTTISFSVESVSSFVKLEIFNVKGQKIKQLVEEQLNQGKHLINWDGTDDTNQPISSGVYLYKLESEGTEYNKKMILMK